MMSVIARFGSALSEAELPCAVVSNHKPEHVRPTEMGISHA